MMNLQQNKLISNHKKYKTALITISKLENKTGVNLIHVMCQLQ